jgi:hypothetical protein
VSNEIFLTLIRFDRELIGPAKSHSCERKAAMNSIERVWARLKVVASKSAGQKTLISMRESQTVVLKLCRQERAETPPRDALHFLAKELVRLTLEAQFPT